jgi:DNA-binding response OmpR family regulator
VDYAPADDCLVKPFAFDERFGARGGPGSPQRHNVKETVLRVGDPMLDLISRAATRGSRNIELTRREISSSRISGSQSGAAPRTRQSSLSHQVDAL